MSQKNSPRTAPVAVPAREIPKRPNKSIYPEPFSSRVSKGREKHVLGDFFGLKNFGVNLTTLEPGSESSLLHRHSHQDEFIYIVEGTPTLRTETEEFLLAPGMCAGFPAGGVAHQLVNLSNTTVVYLEVGDRSPDDVTNYPNDDIVATFGADRKWIFTRKDGTPY